MLIWAEVPGRASEEAAERENSRLLAVALAHGAVVSDSTHPRLGFPDFGLLSPWRQLSLVGYRGIRQMSCCVAGRLESFRRVPLRARSPTSPSRRRDTGNHPRPRGLIRDLPPWGAGKIRTPASSGC